MAETYIGYLDKIEDDIAYYQMTLQSTGQSLFGWRNASDFARAGVQEEGRFQLVIKEGRHLFEDDGVEITPLPDIELTYEDIRRIEEKIHRVLPREDPGVKY